MIHASPRMKACDQARIASIFMDEKTLLYRVDRVLVTKHCDKTLSQNQLWA